MIDRASQIPDLIVPRNRNAPVGLRVLKPIVSPAVADQDTTHRLEPLDEISTLQDTCSWATRRTPRTLPPVRST